MITPGLFLSPCAYVAKSARRAQIGNYSMVFGDQWELVCAIKTKAKGGKEAISVTQVYRVGIYALIVKVNTTTVTENNRPL